MEIKEKEKKMTHVPTTLTRLLVSTLEALFEYRTYVENPVPAQEEISVRGDKSHVVEVVAKLGETVCNQVLNGAFTKGR